VKKLTKIVLLILGLLPYITIVAAKIIMGDARTSTNVLIVTLGFMTMFGILFQWIFYIINVFRNTTVDKNQKGLWVFLLFIGSFVVFPFYWYFHIWRDTGVITAATIPTSCIITQRKEEASYFNNKPAKIMLLITTLLPFVFLLLSIGLRFYTTLNTLFYICVALYYILILGLIILYIINVYRNTNVALNQRTLWAVLLACGNVLVFPFYWYIHIWRKPRIDPTSTSTTRRTPVQAR
jgi:hypothetical protein